MINPKTTIIFLVSSTMGKVFFKKERITITIRMSLGLENYKCVAKHSSFLQC